MSNDPVKGFDRLDPRIQRWIWEKGWTGLRDAQERAVEPLLEGKQDVIIAAQTAAGKTEAAFLPILTNLVRDGEPGLAIYISPLKALINDQWGRLDLLCESLELPVTSWHGDASATGKKKFLNAPRGVLLITPESIEAMFVRRGSKIRGLFSELQYIVIDELHSFIGSDRGKQMQSLLSRIELAIGRRVPRVGLSATLGDMHMAADYLRPAFGKDVRMIVSESTGGELKIQVRGYRVPIRTPGVTGSGEIVEVDAVAQHAISKHLYSVLRGSNNLIFPNSRSKVELYTAHLRDLCESDGVVSEFWPHHGSLSADVRADTEAALRRTDVPATAICTNTLELGIDIGEIASVAQIGPGPSVASLRQRLGRSGRRPGVPAVLRGYAMEQELSQKSPVSDRLREGLVQSVAMIQLLLRRWFEPPNSLGMHFSTLVQQIMSIITERGGGKAPELYDTLTTHGAFGGLTKAAFAQILRKMAEHELLMQDGTGLLLLGPSGERAVAGHDFYAAFASPEEWQLSSGGRILGSLPLTMAVQTGMRVIFAGRRWLVTAVDESSRVISVSPDKGGTPPLFDSGRPNTHRAVREEMRKVLESEEPVRFLDPVATELLTEARNNYREMQLGRKQVIMRDGGKTCILFPWSGDAGNDALALLLRARGVSSADNEGLLVTASCSRSQIIEHLTGITSMGHEDLVNTLKDARNMIRGKWDWALPDDQLRESFASSCLSLTDAKSAANALLTSARSLPDIGSSGETTFSAKVGFPALPSHPQESPDDELIDAEPSQSVVCWSCKKSVMTEERIECDNCGWMFCDCGACGCGATLQ